MGKHSLLITLSIASLVLILTIVSVLGSLNNKIDIKNMLFSKNAVSKAATIAENVVLKKLEDDIKNWQDIIVKADDDIEPSDKEVLYAKYTAKGEHEKAKEVLENDSDLTDEVKEDDVLIYKVARRLKPVDDKELNEYEGKKEMGIFDDELVYPFYKKINNIGFNANLWNIAEEMVGWGLKGVPENEASLVIGSRTIDYQQEYPLEDYVKKINKLNLQGKVSISGDLDETKNTFVSNVVQLYEGKISLYQYSLLEDDFSMIEGVSIESPDWKDATPIITSVYNESNKLMESFIAIYSPSKSLLNLYTYSLIEDRIVGVLSDCNLKGLVSDIEGDGDDVVKLEVGEEFKNINIKDVKITSSYNKNMGLPHVMIGVRGEYLYSDSKNKIQNEDAIYFYDYFPIVDDRLTLSELKTIGEVENWDTKLTWSNTTQTNLLTLIKHNENDIEFLKAMPIIDDYFEEIEPLSKIPKYIEEDEEKIIEYDKVKKLAYASFMDKASNLTKTVLVLNVSGELYQINGNIELEEWDEIYKVEDDSIGDLELVAIKGDISSIHLIDKPIQKSYFNKEIDIEIAVFDQKNDTRTIVKNKYDFKIFSNFDVEYETKDKKRDLRSWNDADLGYVE